MTDLSSNIIRASIHLFAREGILVSEQKIADEAGISPEQIHTYFANRQDLFDAVYITIKQKKSAEIIAEFEMEQDVQTFLFDVWTLYIDWALENKEYYCTMRGLECGNVLSDDVKNLIDYCLMIVHDHFEEGIRKGIFSCVSADFLTATASAQAQAAVDYLLKNEISNQKKHDYIKASFEIFWRGVNGSEAEAA